MDKARTFICLSINNHKFTGRSHGDLFCFLISYNEPVSKKHNRNDYVPKPEIKALTLMMLRPVIIQKETACVITKEQNMHLTGGSL